MEAKTGACQEVLLGVEVRSFEGVGVQVQDQMLVLVEVARRTTGCSIHWYLEVHLGVLGVGQSLVGEVALHSQGVVLHMLHRVDPHFHLLSYRPIVLGEELPCLEGAGAYSNLPPMGVWFLGEGAEARQSSNCCQSPQGVGAGPIGVP